MKHEYAQSCLTLCDPWTVARQAPLSMEIPKNTGVGCHFLCQEIFPTQGSNPVSCISCIGRWVLYQLSQQGVTNFTSRSTMLIDESRQRPVRMRSLPSKPKLLQGSPSSGLRHLLNPSPLSPKKKELMWTVFPLITINSCLTLCLIHTHTPKTSLCFTDSNM